MGERHKEGGESGLGVWGQEGGIVEVAVCCIGLQPSSDREGPDGGLAEEDWEGRECRLLQV